VTLASRYREPMIGRRMPTAAEMAWAKQRLTKPAPKEGELDLTYLYARRTANMAGREASVAAPLHVLRIGPAVIGTLPGEPFAEIGLEFRKRSPVQPAFLVELAHAYFDYLPTPKQHELGGYETWLATNRLEPKASEKMLGTLLEMAAELCSAK